MAINTLITLKDAIDVFVAGHKQLKRVEWEADDYRAPKITEGDEFPVLFVAPIDVNVGRAMNTHTLRMYIYERLNDDRLDVIENANDTSLILRDIRVWWNDYGIDDINIVDDFSGTFASDRELDNLVGYYADVRFEIPSHGRCKVPVNVTPITPIGCADATYQITNIDNTDLYTGTIPSGGNLSQPIQNSTAILKDTDENILSTTPILAEGSEDIIAPDSTYTVQYENGTPIESGNILSGGSVLVEVPDPVTCEPVDVFVGEFNAGSFASGTDVFVNVVQGGFDVIPDDIVVMGNSIDIEIPSCPDTNLEVNGTTEGTFTAGSTIDVQLTDGVSTVVPTSVGVVGDVVTIELPPSATAPVGATLMKTGQTTSYRTGDDGYIEAGRATSFLVLASNNPFGNTNRFTSELGTQTYTNNIVIDWSTFDGNTVLGWYKGSFPLEVWNDAITNSLSLNVAGFNNWRIPNINEFLSIINFGASSSWNYSPFNISSLNVCWTSTTYNSGTSSALVAWSDHRIIARGKTSTSCSFRCRTFTVTGTTLS